MEFQIGDKARVVDCVHGHRFKIGEIVTIDYLDLGDILCYNCSNNTNSWWTSSLELAPIESTIVIKENTGIKDFAMQVVKYLEDHYGEHNNKAFLEVLNSKFK